jgi:hypothetical protein
MSSSFTVSVAVTSSADARPWPSASGHTGRRAAAVAATLLLIATCAIAILVHASLYADGANYLLQILAKHGLLVEWRDRAGVNVITQAPLIIGLHFGLHSMKTAVLLYSAGTLGAPVLIYLLALFFSRGEWYLPIIAAVVVTIYPATFFMSVSESVTAYSVYLLIAVILASSRSLTAIRAIVLLLSSAALPFLYETSVLFGPLLAIWCFSRLRRGDDSTAGRTVLLVPALAGLTGGVTAAWAILHPVDSQAEQGAGTLSGLWASHEFDAACLVLLGALALSLVTRRSSIIAAGEATVLGVGALLTAIGSAPPITSYTIRLAPTLILVPLFIAFWKPEGWQKLHVHSLATRRLGYAVVALVAALAIQNATLLWGWNDFFHSLEHQVYTSQGVVPYSATRLNLAGEYGWSWTFPSMSRIVQESPRQALVENPDPNHWQPFNPAKGAPRADNLYWR